MKKKKWGALVIAITMLFGITACTAKPETQSPGQIYLYGEQHAEEKILQKELEIWKDYYHNDGMRHLFIELSYAGGEFLNIWMESDNDDILDALYEDWTGTLAQNPLAIDFYKRIKEECPDTVFHGIDVGHQYDTTEKRYLEYLEQNGLKDTKQYKLAKEGAGQGKEYRSKRSDVYRENTMTENFIREFDSLDGENIMGIFGKAHTGLDDMEYMTGTVPCMGNQLKQHYGDIVHSEDLTWISKDIEPLKVDTLEVNGKSYEASYFGKYQISEDGTWCEFWRLKDAYEDFKDNKKNGVKSPYTVYPMLIEEEQVFYLVITKPDGSVIEAYERSDGNTDGGQLVTERFNVE
ncbi:hypothetical protein NE683_14065 [Bariatricus massiliensis]|uniref:Uncharacterized protein n=1 Tax=Bariatricus massiliensis TaxID=1745713 RepID=A0ABS8DLK2_9FIRM|nr:hypothetical protein [Bariatricus massiliensis]MCB7306118.1 hypothetical protein [Bariatricus massiliensis]MCB7376673.1 hypothetical protein [Bariatricus massiliensis]MCB7389331.1 hypothetical protein [Bariatricus massiliensis]MCB7413482.1 hypothetical protein [Bariatricus massiliensis]MCQ5254347.1 hypothetical protein [Bariatricus massiliensis]